MFIYSSKKLIFHGKSSAFQSQLLEAVDSKAILVHALVTAIFCPCCGSDFHSVLAEGQLWAVFGVRALPARSRKVLLQT